jgi:predicted polyphosphate/ATP-dependent NAD kinase
MRNIGIIANPSSGKDIRRLVSQALVVGNREKVNIVKRVLIGAHAAGANEVIIMPDRYGIGNQSVHDLKHRYPEVVAGVSILNMPLEDSGADSTFAANLMCKQGVDCIITLGGDGTVRAASKGAGEIPLLPISTGTNNVIPEFIEGTIAGMAAGYFSITPREKRKALLDRQKRLDLLINGEVVDTALVDIAVISDQHVGSHAVWEPEKLLQVAVTRAAPTNIGFTSIIGKYQTIECDSPFGAMVIFGEKGKCYRVQAAIGPGLIFDICVDEFQKLQPGKPISLIPHRPVVLAMDGEREIVLSEKDSVEILLCMEGPYFINTQRVMESTQPAL